MDSMLRWEEKKNVKVAATPLTPAKTGMISWRSGVRAWSRSPDARPARSFIAVNRTSELRVSTATGHRPECWPAFAIAMNRTPNAAPAASPSVRPAEPFPRKVILPPLAATSAIAGSATIMPSTVSSPGRSPMASPATTGTTAAPTAETGPTTLI